MEHAHFLQMGGFKLCCTHDEKRKFIDVQAYQIKGQKDTWEGVVTLESFSKLLGDKQIDFPPITKEEINDKRKVDGLSKCLALLQLSWFIIQIFARVWLRLAISELELTTAALAMMNFVMYFFWWNKPLNAQYPTVLRSRKSELQTGERRLKVVKRLRASASNAGSPTFRRNNASFPLTENQQVFKDHVDTPAATLGTKKLPRKWLGVDLWRQVWVIFDLLLHSIPSKISKARKPTDTPAPHRIQSQDETFDLFDQAGFLGMEIMEHPEPLQRTTKRKRWIKISVILSPLLLPLVLLAIAVVLVLANVTAMLAVIGMVVALPLEAMLRKGYTLDPHSSVLLRLIRKLPGIHHTPRVMIDVTRVNRALFYSEHACGSSGIFGLIATLVGAIFGALHCLGWKFSFPSSTEQTLWRVSSLVMVSVNVYIAVGISILLKLSNLVRSSKDAAPSHDPTEGEKGEAKSGNKELQTTDEDIVLFLSIVFASVIHAIARSTLLAVAISSLRSLPPSAFDAVEWSDVIPHV